MLSQHLEQGLPDLSSINGHACCLHLIHLLLIQLHEFNVWVFIDRLHLVIDCLVVAVDAIDVFEQAVKH